MRCAALTLCAFGCVFGCGDPPADDDVAGDLGIDGALPVVDASAPDDGATADAAQPADFGADMRFGSCSAAGVPGVCVDVALCDGTSTPGLCPGPSSVQCCTPGCELDGGCGGTCDPSDRPTPNEGLGEDPGDSGCPPGMADLGTFCIDRYEASLVMVDDSGAIGSWSPYHRPEGVRVAARSIAGAVPQGYLSGVDAAAACAEAGKRLCTDVEWLAACRGSTDRTYPYGDTRIDGRCNDARGVHPAVERFGTSEEWIWSQLGDACINQLPESLALTGAHPQCVTPEGVFDLMGNLHEWTADPAGTFRGGFYADTRNNGEGCLYRTTAHSMGHWDYSTGFRCCAD